MTIAPVKSPRGQIFLASVFFVLGFSLVFSIVGVLLQTILTNVSYTVQEWLGRVGGVIVIVFGLYLLGLFKPAFLERGYKVSVKMRFRSQYVTSFVFGAAFAIGWTPCVSVALGAILALAITEATSAFILLMAYTLGLGVPFLLVGAFAEKAQGLIQRMGRSLVYLQYLFGIILVAMGILVFIGQLARVANMEILTDVLTRLNLVSGAGQSITSISLLNLSVAFLAGLGSFLSPCILPLIPGYLSYLASSSVKEQS